MSLSRTGRIVILDENWGHATKDRVQAVLESVYSVLTDAFCTEPSAEILVSWRAGEPSVDPGRPHNVYLSARCQYWSQYAYQFGHELCHILTNYDLQPKSRHRWMDETVCILASVFAISRLGTTWQEDPPHYVDNPSGFAPHHRKYVEDWRTKNCLVGGERAEWFNRQLPELERCIDTKVLYSEGHRRLQRTIAEALLDSFLQSPALWREVGLLNTWNPIDDGSFSEYLTSWKRRCMESGYEGHAVLTLCRILGVQQPSDT